MESTVTLYVLIAIVPICGVIMAVTPYFMPRNECFAVTVPEIAQEDARIKTMKGHYRAIVLVITAICTAAAAFILPAALDESDDAAFALVYIVATVVPIVASFGLMLVYRGRIQNLKAQEGWDAPVQLASASIDNDIAPDALSVKWCLLFVPILLFTSVLIWALYPYMPTEIPMHAGFSGEVDSYTLKTPVTACYPLFVEIFLMLVFTLSIWMISRSKKHVDPQKPSSSSYAYGVFARSQSILLLVMGAMVSLMIGTLFPLASAGILSLMQAALIIVMGVVVVLVAVFVVTLRYGQSGSRVFRETASEDNMSHDEDSYWKLGVFYVNRNDPAVYVPKRFGFGWTINLGSPRAWLFILALIALIIVFVWASIVCF